MKIKKILIITGLAIGISAFAGEPEYDHIFFDEALMSGAYFYSGADYTAPSYVMHIKNKLPVSEKQFFTVRNSLLLHYVSSYGGQWSATVNYPNWRGKDNIKSCDFLDFRIYIDTPLSTGELPLIAISKTARRDTIVSDFISFEPYMGAASSKTWLHVHIPLKLFNLEYRHSKEINRIIFKQSGNDGKEHILYIDQMELVPSEMPQIKLEKPVLTNLKAFERHVDLVWSKDKLEDAKYIKIYRSEDGNLFRAVGMQDPQRGRYADYTGICGKKYFYRITALDAFYKESDVSNVLSAETLPMTDEQLLDMVQEASFRYYWEGAEPHSGLALENIPGRKNMIASGASGFGIMAIITGVERGYITREQAVERFVKIVDFLKKADRFHGVYAHFMDGPTAKAEPFFGNRDNGADLLETAFLFQGLLTARQYFDRDTKEEKYIKEGITRLWQEIEWSWYKRTPDSKYLYWHWSPDQAWVINHKLIGWNETMIAYILAIASPTHGIDKSMYYSGWASQEEEAQTYRSNWGKTAEGNMYFNRNTYFGIKLDVGVSSGGPLFFIHYSYMGLNPNNIKDKFMEKDYFNNFKNIALINHRYCIENPKNQLGYAYDCWGLTASDGPWRYQAAEPAQHKDEGTMAPTGALASFPYTPVESMAALRNYYRNYGSFLWGEYGFRDAFNLNENWCARIYMGLNQAPVTVMIENYRTGKIWNLFMSNPEIKKMVDELFENK